MMNLKRIIASGLILFSLASAAQISGTVMGNENGKTIPLPGANVFWKGTSTGAITDANGRYSIEKVAGANTLVVTFVGYQHQSKIIISPSGTVNFTLEVGGEELGEVEVVGKVDATSLDIKRADLSFNIDDKELRKAACCNLSESFETNASVDVSFTDAVTGTKQIEMLGLAGKYALIQRENIPFARGLNTTTGLTFIPGTFVESIQLTKGLSSVLNGYESVTGQINVELYKPDSAPKLFLNAYGNQGGRMELNAISAFDVNDKLSTAFLVHGSNLILANDHNQDGFTDMPTGSQVNLSNRWYYNGKNGWEGQIGINAIRHTHKGGQLDYVNEADPADSLWGYDSKGDRIELFGKTGYVYEGHPFRSFGVIYSLSYQDVDMKFGDREYLAEQKTAYLNTIYQDIIGNKQNTYRTGISFLAEEVTENLLPHPVDGSLYYSVRTELVPGAYFEYAYEPTLNFTLVAGSRLDYNSYFNQIFFTPRLNMRYSITENTTFRIGGGRGQRTANIINENINVLASSRSLIFGNYEIQPEVGWNTGMSIDQDIEIGEKKIDFTIDAFYTWFENKLVTDLDFSALEAHIFNAQGSRSFSLLGQIDYELFEGLDLRLAYKYLDAQDPFLNGTDLSYLIPQHRAFWNVNYSPDDKWKIDATVNWFGRKRLPNTQSSPEIYQRPDWSDDFITVNMQINRVFEKGLELFIGSENLFDFRQTDPIINAENPNAPYFDSNFAWGPIFGRNIYAGLYYKLD